MHIKYLMKTFYFMKEWMPVKLPKSNQVYFLIMNVYIPALRLSVISCVNCGSVPRLWSISVRLGGEMSCWNNPSRITAPTPSDFRYGSRSDTPEWESNTIMLGFTTGISLLFTSIRPTIQSILCWSHSITAPHVYAQHFTMIYHVGFIVFTLSVV